MDTCLLYWWPSLTCQSKRFHETKEDICKRELRNISWRTVTSRATTYTQSQTACLGRVNYCGSPIEKKKLGEEKYYLVLQKNINEDNDT